MGRNISFNRLASLRNEILDLGVVFCGGSFSQSPCEGSDGVHVFRSNREMLDCLWNVRILTYEACNLHGVSSGWWGYLQNLYSEWEFVRNSLALRYMPLVKSVARKYSHPNQGFEDLVQEGATGMLRALDSFDVEYGVPFEAYARPWIKKYLGQCVECHSEVVRLPETLAKKRRRKRRENPCEAQENNCEWGFSGGNLVSLSFSNAIAGETSANDFEVNDDKSNLEKRFSHRETVRFLNQCVESLDSMCRKVLQLRYFAEKRLSLDEIAQKCGFSREKIRKIEKQALDYMKKKL